MTTLRTVATLAFTALAFALPARAGAQTAAPVADPLFRLDPVTRVRVEAIVDSARAIGLPEAPLRNKALEGRAKKADSKRIVASVSELFARMRLAHASLKTVDASELEAGAGAISAGIKPVELAEFKSSIRGRSPLKALTHMTDMIVRLGVRPTDAVPTFIQLWKGGSTDAELDGLWTQVNQDILSGGVNPGTALQQRARQLPPRIIRSPEE